MSGTDPDGGSSAAAVAPSAASATVSTTLSVSVAFSPAPGQVERVELELPAGSTLADALRASGLIERHPQLPTLPAGIRGRACPPQTLLRDGDRVEAWRPLCFDPMESRRRRQAHRQAARPARRRRGGSPPVSGNRS